MVRLWFCENKKISLFLAMAFAMPFVYAMERDEGPECEDTRARAEPSQDKDAGPGEAEEPEEEEKYPEPVRQKQEVASSPVQKVYYVIPVRMSTRQEILAESKEYVERRKGHVCCGHADFPIPEPVAFGRSIREGLSYQDRSEMDMRLRTAAAIEGDWEAVSMLIDRGADVDAADDEGRTVLMHAIKNGDEETCAVLLAAGADVNRADKDRKESALIKAVRYGTPDMVYDLLLLGAHLDHRDVKGFSALMWATIEAKFDAQKILEEHNTLLHAKPKAKVSGETDLITAIRHGMPMMVKDLLVAGANVDQPDAQGVTPLMWAVSEGGLGYRREKIMRTLLVKNPSLDVQNKAGNTALMLAVRHKKNRIVALLIECGARANIKNRMGNTAFEIAQDVRNWAVLELLDQQMRRDEAAQTGGVKCACVVS